MSEEKTEDAVEEVTEKVEEAAEAVPEPVVTPEPDKPAPKSDGMPEWAEQLGDRIVSAIDALKEASPITEAAEDVVDEIPVKRPWTHRGFGGK